MKVKSESEVAQSCPTLSDLMDCSLQGSSVHGIFQARVLQWGAIAFSRIYVLHLSKFIDCSTPRVNPNVNYGLWGMVICQCRLIHCNRCSLLVGNVDILGKSECMCCGGYMVYGTLYFLLIFSVNLPWRCPKKINLSKQVQWQELWISSHHTGDKCIFIIITMGDRALGPWTHCFPYLECFPHSSHL